MSIPPGVLGASIALTELRELRPEVIGSLENLLTENARIMRLPNPIIPGDIGEAVAKGLETIVRLLAELR